jgi:hypothetical protein
MSPRGTCIISHGAGSRGTASRSPAQAVTPLVVAALLAIGSSVQAATVTAVQGQVLVNSGQGYRLVDGTTHLDAGGTVVANPGAVAHVSYPGGCQVTVEPGSVYLIAAKSPCQSGEPTQTAGGLGEKAAPPSGWSLNPWMLGGAALAVGGGVAYGVMSISP